MQGPAIAWGHGTKEKATKALTFEFPSGEGLHPPMALRLEAIANWNMMFFCVISRNNVRY